MFFCQQIEQIGKDYARQGIEKKHKNGIAIYHIQFRTPEVMHQAQYLIVREIERV